MNNYKEFKNKYKALENKYKLLWELMDQIPDVIYFKDTEGKLIMVNRAHARAIGLRPEEVVGKTDFDIFPKERARVIFKDDQRVMKEGKPIIDKVERGLQRNGTDIYVSTTKIPRFDEQGKIIGLIGITRDITRRVQFERLREENSLISKKLETLEELNKMKSEFVSIVSHELRTPLAIIKDVIMLLIDEIVGPVKEKQRGLLLKAKENIARLNNIIEELLDISRIESGKIKMHYSLVNLNDLLMDSSVFFKKLAQEKGVDLKYSLPRSQINIFIDAERVNQVVTNLINNAIKFTEQNGRIKVEVRIFETKIRVGVIDSGVGIARHDLPKIFDKFVQLANESQAERKGIGLGLTIAKELVEKNGGEIWAESELGVGSKFYFTLPRFYTDKALTRDIREKINSLLEKDLPVFFVNLMIVNYAEFRKRINIEPRKLFDGLKGVIEEAFKGFYHRSTKELEIALQDSRGGELGIIFSKVGEHDDAKFCDLLKHKVRKYFEKNRFPNVFINLGVISYPPESGSVIAKHFPGNINIRKICIGSEIRRFPRIRYKLDIEIILPEKEVESAETIDISEGGVCIIAKRKLETDARIEARLKLPKEKEPLSVRARVAWMKHMDVAPGAGSERHKFGLEFLNLGKRDRKVISGFIKSVSRKMR